MITMEQIKDKLIGMGFKLNDIPRFDSYTGEKFKNVEVIYTKAVENGLLRVVFNELNYGSSGILQNDNQIHLYLQNFKSKTIIQFWWNLFLQLLEEHTK